MPGLFGGIGCADSHVYARLRDHFRDIWGKCESLEGHGWAIGGHAFGAKAAVFEANRCCYAIDGAYSTYTQGANDSSQFSHDFHLDDRVVRLGATFIGNVALIDPASQTLHLALDSSGTFPLYLTYYGGGALFSSHLRPLARVTRTAVDDIGLLEFVRTGFTFAGRSTFSQIRRLLAGQSIRYDAVSGVAEVQELSRAWAGTQAADPPDAIVDASWRLLGKAARQAMPTGERIGLMLSGGWDSRTLLAALCAHAPGDLMCYSHGDPDSRELKIAARLASACSADWRWEPIDSRVLDLQDLQQGFRRVENVVFPHWHRAGRLLAQMSITCATAGVYGEVMGGHYGPSMLMSGGRRTMTAVANSLFQGPRTSHRGTAAQKSAESLLRAKRLRRHWYLEREFEESISSTLERINADVDADLTRLRQRGVPSGDRLVEAFMAEHRGSQYINAQLLSVRADVDVALPFAMPELLDFVSTVPISLKMHNSLNLHVLRRHAPRLLDLPMAATLVSAKRPLFLQEASRLARSAYEHGRSALSELARGRVRPPRLGWVNFEFLRSGEVLRHLVDDLRCDYWDRDALERRLSGLASDREVEQLHPIYDQLAKVYTVDLLCR